MAHSQVSKFPVAFILLFFCLAISQGLQNDLMAQSTQEQRRAFTIPAGQDTDQLLLVDELGLELARIRFFESVLDMTTYRLDTGDLLGLVLEGNVTGTLRGLRVNSQGTLLIPQAGLVEVSGILFSEAEKKIQDVISRVYPDTHVRLVLEHPRTIQVHVVGNIPYAGPQLVLPNTRVDQAIYRSFFQPSVEPHPEGKTIPADDPLSPGALLANKYPDHFIQKNHYALRHIVINRKDGSVVKADLVRYLKTGDLEFNPVVHQGDIISIRRNHDYNPRISISGAVHQPLDLEYRPDDTINNLIRMAGGRTYDASSDHVRIIRLTGDGITEEVLDETHVINHYSLLPNDRVIVPYDRKKRGSHSARVYGEAHYTGRFPIIDGVTTVYDLMKLAGGLTSEALPRAAYLIRSQPGKTEYGLQRDILKNLLEPRLQTSGNMFGAHPGFIPDFLKRTSDQYEEGFLYLDLEAALFRHHVHINLMDEKQMQEIRLFDGDRLQIPRNDGTIFLFGQVNRPGYYTFDKTSTYDDYIERAGGFALSADQDRIFVIKAGTSSWHRADEASIESGDLVFIDRHPFDELKTAREYELRKRELRNNNIQIMLATMSTIASVITAYVAITR